MIRSEEPSLLCNTPSLPANGAERGGIRPAGPNGQPLNLNFEDGTPGRAGSSMTRMKSGPPRPVSSLKPSPRRISVPMRSQPSELLELLEATRAMTQHAHCKMNPPLGAANDREALLEGLADGSPIG